MKVTFESVGNSTLTEDWLNKAINNQPSKALSEAGKEGVASLRRNTPIGKTGETANGWDYKVETNSDSIELSFVNNAHPEASVNVAKLIELGHGTGTGGYVPPRPYIKGAMEPVFNKTIDKIVKEMIE